MPRPKVKICGITNLEDARFCAAAGADYLGFIQVPESPRYVDPGLCKEIIQWVFGAQPVAVFVNESVEAVNELVRQAGFALVQAHGDEDPAWCAAVDVPVIKSLSVAPGTSRDELRRRIDTYAPHVRAVLLDTFSLAERGGTGRSFDWAVAEGLSDAAPLFLAGGLSPENVIEAAQAVHPYGIDVSSRIEESPGRKDFDRVTALFDRLEDHFGPRS